MITNFYVSPLTLWVRTPLMWGVLDTTLCDKVCQWLATVVFSGYWLPQYSWNIVESGIKHYKSPLPIFFKYMYIGWEVIVHFVDIGRIGDHHCLNFVFIIMVTFQVKSLWVCSDWPWRRNDRSCTEGFNTGQNPKVEEQRTQ